MIIRFSISDHATKGVIVATSKGTIIWRGGSNNIHLAIKLGADALHLHTDDAPALQRAFEKAGHTVKYLI